MAIHEAMPKAAPKESTLRPLPGPVGRANPTLVLTLASLKMYFRNRQGLFWSFILPVLIMAIFGMLNLGAFGTVSLGVVDEAQNELSRGLVEALRGAPAIKLSVGELAAERAALEKGERDVVLVMPAALRSIAAGAAFGGTSGTGGPVPIAAYFNQGRQPQSQVALLFTNEVLGRAQMELAGTPPLFRLEPHPVHGRSLRYVDFLIPGVVAMSIMQMGIFSVTFTFIEYKQRGILRRMLATPLRPASFLVGQVTTRLLISVLQTLVLVSLGIVVLRLHFAGNLGWLALFSVLGGGTFLAMGFAISGFAKTEEAAAPIGNLVAMPMMFLSGVFFPRDVIPGLLRGVTDYLPLSFLADAMRAIALDGAAPWDLWRDLLGLAVWLVVSFVLAVRLFRWE